MAENIGKGGQLLLCCAFYHVFSYQSFCLSRTFTMTLFVCVSKFRPPSSAFIASPHPHLLRLKDLYQSEGRAGEDALLRAVRIESTLVPVEVGAVEVAKPLHVFLDGDGVAKVLVHAPPEERRICAYSDDTNYAQEEGDAERRVIRMQRERMKNNRGAEKTDAKGGGLRRIEVQQTAQQERRMSERETRVVDILQMRT